MMHRGRWPYRATIWAKKEGRELREVMQRHGVTAIELAEASQVPLALVESAMDYPKDSRERAFAAGIVAIENWIEQGTVTDFLTGARKLAGQI